VVLCACLLVPSPGRAAEGPDPYLDFARHLSKEGDYYRAVTEAKRFIFLNPRDPRIHEAWLLIGRAYIEGGQFQEARGAFGPVVAQRERPDLALEAMMDLGRCLEHLDPRGDAIAYYRGLIREPSLPPERASDIRNQARYRLGWLYLEDGRWEEARQAFEEVEADHRLKSSARELADRAPQGGDLPRKSPAAAGLMSALLPGSGQVYVGRPTDAALAFGLNALFLWGAAEAYDDENWAVFTLLGAMEIGWYGGNIYNAVNGAHAYNQKLDQDFIKGLRREHGWRLGLDPRHQGLLLSWTLNY